MNHDASADDGIGAGQLHGVVVQSPEKGIHVAWKIPVSEGELCWLTIVGDLRVAAGFGFQDFVVAQCACAIAIDHLMFMHVERKTVGLTVVLQQAAHRDVQADPI